MTVLINEFWPWVVIGISVCVWGIKTIDLPLAQWVQLLTSLIYSPLIEDTKAEKRQLDHPTEEFVSANPGCAMVAIGVILTLFGLFRWLSW